MTHPIMELETALRSAAMVVWKFLRGYGRSWNQFLAFLRADEDKAKSKLAEQAAKDGHIKFPTVLAVDNKRDEHIQRNAQITVASIIAWFVAWPVLVFLFGRWIPMPWWVWPFATFGALTVHSIRLGFAEENIDEDTGFNIDPYQSKAVNGVSADGIVAALRTVSTPIDRAFQGFYDALAMGGTAHPPIAPFLPVLSEEHGGIEAEVHLPDGVKVTVADIVKQHDAFAGEMGFPTAQVRLSKGRTAKHLKILVMPKALHEMEMPQWPYLDGRRADVFGKGIIIGVDTYGTPVWFDPLNSFALGGIPNHGKSTLFLAITAAMATARTKFLSFDFGGAGTFAHLKSRSIVYRSGRKLDDMQAYDTALKWALQEMTRRADLFAELPDHLRRKGKLTKEIIDWVETASSELAREIRESGGFDPIMIVVDEAHVPAGFEDVDENSGYVAREGRKWFMYIAQATQTWEVDAVPTGFLKSAQTQFAFRLNGHMDTLALLGAGVSYPEPHNKDPDTVFHPGMFKTGGTNTFIEVDGVKQIPDVARAFNIDQGDAARVVAMADLEPVDDLDESLVDTDTRGVVDMVLDVWPVDPDTGQPVERVRSQYLGELVEAEDWPGMSVRGAMTSALKAAGVEPLTNGTRYPDWPVELEPATGTGEPTRKVTSATGFAYEAVAALRDRRPVLNTIPNPIEDEF